jgi:preprotein translocase subunit SecE
MAFNYNDIKRPAKGLFKKLKFMSKISDYIRESIAELKKVTWPNKKQTTNYTLLIVAISLGLALFIGVIDYLLQLGIQQVIK